MKTDSVSNSALIAAADRARADNKDVQQAREERKATAEASTAQFNEKREAERNATSDRAVDLEA
jgi:hypothetical protein